MTQPEPLTLFRLRSARWATETGLTLVQRFLGVGLWVIVVGLTVYLSLTISAPINWAQLAVFIALHMLSSALAIRLPGGSQAGFMLTNLTALALVLGVQQAMTVSLIASAVLVTLVVAASGLLGARLASSPLLVIETMYTSAANSLTVAASVWIYERAGGTLALLQTGLFVPLAVAVFALSSTAMTLWQIAGRADWRDFIRRFWLIIVISHLVSLVAVPALAVDYHAEGPLGFGLVVYLGGVLMLFLFNYLYLDLQHRVANLAVLNSIGQALSARLELGDLLPLIRREIGKLLDVSGFYLALVDEESRLIFFPVDFEENRPISYDTLPLDGNSITAHVIRLRRPLIIKHYDLKSLAHEAIEPAGRAVKSYLGVPIFGGDQVIGVLALRSYTHEYRYDEEDAKLLQQVAAQAGIALQNARLFSRTQRQASELSSLQEVSSLMTASTDLQDVIRAICRIVVEVMGYQKAAVFLLDETGRMVHLVDSLGLSEAFVEESQSFSVNEKRAEVFRTGQPVIVDNLMIDERFEENPGPARNEGVHSVLEVPLALGDRMLGSIAAYYDVAHPITANDISLLQTLGGQIAIAVANARLFEATVERSKELETLYEAGATVNASLSLKNVLRALSVSMIRALRVPNCTIWLATEDRRALRASLRMVALGSGADEEPIIAVTLELEDMPAIHKAITHSQPVVLKVDAPDLAVSEQRLLYQCRITMGMALPLVMHNTLHGLIVIPPRSEGQDFNAEETRLAVGLAHQAAVAIDNARRFERTDVALNRRLDEISALERISQRIASHLDLADVIDEVAQAALVNTGSEYIDVALLDEKTHTLHTLIRRSAIPDQAVTASWSADGGLTGRAVRTRQVVYVGDVNIDSSYVRARDNVLSELVVPIVLEDRVLGIVNLESTRLSAFTDDHARFVNNLAEHAAIAIFNAGLYESERRQRQIAELLLETSGIVASSPNLSEVLLTLSEQLLRISGFHGCTIFEIDEAEGRAYALAEHIHGIWPQGRGRTFRLEDYPTTAHVLQSAAPAIVHRGVDSPDPSELALMSDLGVELLVMFPVRAGKRVIGLAEIMTTSPDLMNSHFVVENCQQVLEKAASWLAAPLRANPSSKLIELGSELFRAGGGHCCCTLSEWDEPSDVVRALVDFGDLVWAPRRGPCYRISDYPELLRVLHKGTSEVFQSSDSSEQSPVKMRPQRGAPTLVIQPLSRKGTPIGIVELFNVSGASEVSEDDLRVWRLVADQASVAIENARLFEAIQRRGEEFSTLRTVALETASSPDLATTLHIIVRHALERSGALDTQIHLYDRANDLLSLGATVHRSSEHKRDIAPPRPKGLTTTVAHSGERLVVTDLANHPLFADVMHLPSWQSLKSILGVPLKSGDEVVGVFTASFDDERGPDDNVLHFFDLLAAQAAITIENTWLAEATRTGRDRLQAILDSSYDGIIMLDPQGYLLMANPRAEYLFNIRLADKIGWNALDIIRQMRGVVAEQEPDFLLKELVRVGRIIKQDPMATTRQRYVLENPTRAIEVVTTGVQGRHPELLGRLIILHDVTYQYEIEAYRQDVSSMIVHDLRSPLSSLITGLEMALGEINNLPPEVRSEMLKVPLNVGMNSANSLLKLVEGMLDVNKLEAGEVPLVLTDVNLRDVVRRACERLEAVAMGALITLQTDIPEGLPNLVADSEKIERVVVNLVDNALRYTPQDGAITIAVHAGPGIQTVTVSDTGEGIPPEYHERIFERFFQINPKRRQRGSRGIGLGLTFCRLAVEAHRGRIWVDSGSDGGAAFHFSLPSNLTPTSLTQPMP